MKRKCYISKQFLKFTGILLVSLLAISCATKPAAYLNVDDAVGKAEYSTALAAIEKGQEQKTPIYPVKNAVMLHLDKGLLQYYAELNGDSSKDLQEAERLIEEAYTKSVSADFMSYIANDNTKDYPGEDFEDIYLNVFNALNYYRAGDIEGALVEIRKLSMSSGKLDMLSRKYEQAAKSSSDKAMEQLNKLGFRLTDSLPKPGAINFSNSALARYLAALFLLAEKNTDGARIELDQLAAAFKANPNVYSFSVPSTVAQERSVPAGKARLNVIAFAGLSPVKEEKSFTQNWPFMSNTLQQHPVFKLPVFVDRPSSITGIEVIVNEDQKFNLELIEDMGAVIKETYGARFAELFFKTYIRVLIKYITADTATQATKKVGGLAGAIGGLAATVGGKIASDVSEAADIRMSRYLPNKAYVGGINLDPGTYNIAVNFLSGSNVVASAARKDFTVNANTLNLIDAVSLK